MKIRNIELKQIFSHIQIKNELMRGNYVVFTDYIRNGEGVDTRDIVYYDKKNKRFRFMLGHVWTEDFLKIFPVTGVICEKGIKDYSLMCNMGNLALENYDRIFSVKPKFIEVIGDKFENIPFRLGV